MYEYECIFISIYVYYIIYLLRIVAIFLVHRVVVRRLREGWVGQKGLVATRFSLFSLVFLTALTDLFFEARALSHPPGVVAAQKSRALWVFGVMPLSSLLALARLLAVIAPWLFMPCSNSSKC